MFQAIRTFLNRPIAEDFSFKSQIWPSVQAGIYVFLFIYFSGGSSLPSESAIQSRVLLLALFGLGCAVSTLVANWVVPTLLPTIYNEDHWTVWKYMLQTLFVLFCISVSNQAVLILTHNQYPTFGEMYLSVTLIGFFPISTSVFVLEQRRLKRNLAHARALNDQLAHRLEPLSPAVPVSTSIVTDKPAPTAPALVVLTSDSGKERLSLRPDQLIYIESVGNYIDIHWLNGTQPQQTVLRSTLKEVADQLSPYRQFFRSHRAFLINLNAVNQTEGNARGYQLTLSGIVAKIPVSRGYLAAFDEQMNALVGEAHSL